MGSIKKLPAYIINRLKAGEIVERPSSVVKELLENALDAGAKNIVLEIKDGGKKLIRVQDDGIGIAKDDIVLTVERYATSKIYSDEDLMRLHTYGFRGEALSAISEVSKFRLITKYRQSLENNIGYELIKVSDKIDLKPIPIDFSNGTIVYVEDIFYNVPVRKKYLKSAQTEEKYIYSIFLNIALANPEVSFIYIKDGKTKIKLDYADSLYSRILQIYDSSWEKNLKIVENIGGGYKIFGVVSDPNLTFLSPDFIKIFVNGRYVVDKIVKKAILEAFYRQLPHNEYPLAILFLELDSNLVDVNVHPRKLEVKFLDPGSIYNFVKQSIDKLFQTDKISSGNKFISKSQFYEFKSNRVNTSKLDLDFEKNVSYRTGFETKINESIDTKNINFKIIGQLWNSYILLENEDNLYIVDQHALAERIKFEKMRKEVLENNIKPYLLLEPLVINISDNIQNIEEKINKLNSIGFDIGILSKNKLVVYALPEVFEKYKLDITNLINKLIYTEDDINLNLVLDQIWANKACKTSIKAGQPLSMQEMQNLIKEGFEYIGGQFVCQHGRPSFVKIDKDNILSMFDR